MLTKIEALKKLKYFEGKTKKTGRLQIRMGPQLKHNKLQLNLTREYSVGKPCNKTK